VVLLQLNRHKVSRPAQSRGFATDSNPGRTFSSKCHRSAIGTMHGAGSLVDPRILHPSREGNDRGSHLATRQELPRDRNDEDRFRLVPLINEDLLVDQLRFGRRDELEPDLRDPYCR